MKHSETYRSKKAKFDSYITVYGRNAVLEMLQDDAVSIVRLHMSTNNKQEGIITKILALADERDIEVREHTKVQLSRISRNAKQDQGVALDILAPNYRSAQEYLKAAPVAFRLLALDGIQNPQNLGMIIRSAAAGSIDAIILPKKKSAKISPLVIKASAGTLFKIDILYCDTLEEVLGSVPEGTMLYALSSHAPETIYDIRPAARSVFVLGNENEGVSEEMAQRCNASVAIPMNRGVESLNVAVTAALIAFMRS